MSNLLDRIEQEADRRRQIEEMMAVTNEREARREAGMPAAMESATPFDGAVLDPRTGTYKNRSMLSDTYDPSAARAAADGGFQGVTLGWGDEIAGAIGGFDPDARAFYREMARARLEEAQREHPIAFGAGEVGGAVTASLPYAKLATGKSIARWTRSARLVSAGRLASCGQVATALKK